MPQSETTPIPAQGLYSELRRVAASNPRVARQRLVDLVQSADPRLEPMLELMRPASEGRMRQLVATTVHSKRHLEVVRDRFVPHLIAWQDTEPDEFTKPAILAALSGLDLAAYAATNSVETLLSRSNDAKTNALFSKESVEIYRWVAGRLCHRIRNSLELPAACVADAIHQAAVIADDAIRSNITQRLIEAQQAFRQVGRIVDFNIDDEAFRRKPVPVIPWLRRMTEQYRAKHEPVLLNVVSGTHEPGPYIFANDILLEVAFWNLWRNAAESVQDQCIVTARVTVEQGQISVVLIDNGPGLRPEHASEAFSVRLSTHGEERGRGLLEVADAMRQLQGSARVIPIDGRYRVELLFPQSQVPHKEAS